MKCAASLTAINRNKSLAAKIKLRVPKEKPPKSPRKIFTWKNGRRYNRIYGDTTRISDDGKYKIVNGRWQPYHKSNRSATKVNSITPEPLSTSTESTNKKESEPQWMKELEQSRKKTAGKFKRRPRSSSRTKELKTTEKAEKEMKNIGFSKDK